MKLTGGKIIYRRMELIEMISCNLRRATFESLPMKNWVESHIVPPVLNLFAGPTLLSCNEIRNDINTNLPADYHMDALDFVNSWKGESFSTIVLDPPYSYRKAMEMYEGNYSSRFKQIADAITRILGPNGKVISFGYHSSFMGRVRGYELDRMCVFAHGGAQHCTIAIIETCTE